MDSPERGGSEYKKRRTSHAHQDKNRDTGGILFEVLGLDD